VCHIHWHVIPRFEKDGLELWPQGSYADAGAMQEMAKKISLAIEQ
jgi:histidine triad (HIT) family protein